MTNESGVELPVSAQDGAHARYVSDAAASLLRDLGVKYLPINPGSSFRGLHDSVVNHAGNRDPQLLLCVHEEIAVAMAHAYSKATGTVGVAAVHDLVGLMHASMAVYNAWCDGVPLLLLGGGGPARSSTRRGIDWIHSASAQASFVREFVKWDEEPLDTEGLLGAIAKGHALAASAPPGPVYVTLDMELQEQELDGRVEASKYAGCVPVSLAAPHDTVDAAARVLTESQHPVVVAGNLGFDAAATTPLVELVETLGAAYCDDHNAVAFPTSHPQNLSGASDIFSDEVDVVLAIDVRDIADIANSCAPGTRIVDVSLRHLRYRGWTNAGGSPAGVEVQVPAAPAEGTSQLLAELRKHRPAGGQDDTRTARVRVIEERHASVRRAQQQELGDRWEDMPIAPPRMVAEVWNAVRDRDWLLVLRNTRSWLEGIWDFDSAGQWLGHSVGGGVGYGAGAMLGGALAARERGQTAVAIVGDGDLQMGIGAIWTAVHYEIPLLIVVNNNRSFYNDEQHQRQVARDRGRPVENAWIGMRMSDPEVDFTELARGYGAWARKPIVDPGDLGTELRAALEQVDAGRVALVDVRTAPE